MIGALVVALIRGYQRWYPAAWKRHCLYDPSCSEYMLRAIAKHGTWSGIRRGLARIYRCRPPVMDWHDEP